MRPKLRIWRFTYGADHTMYDPAWPTLTVRARTRREARKRAEAKVPRLLNQGRAYWEWLDGQWHAIPPTKGGLMSWSKGEIVESHWARKRADKARRERLAKTPLTLPKMGAMDGTLGSFAAFITMPILQVIEDAPVIADLFKTVPAPDGDTPPSIPLVRWAYTRAKPKGPPS